MRELKFCFILLESTVFISTHTKKTAKAQVMGLGDHVTHRRA